MSDQHRACRNCEYWDQMYDIGICRRHAPKPVLNCLVPNEEESKPTSNAVWPSTAEGDWCGEFSPEINAYSTK